MYKLINKRKILTSAVAFFVLFLFSSTAQTQQSNTPTKIPFIDEAWIKANLKKQGPKIIVTTDVLKEMQASIKKEPAIKAYYQYLYKNAEALINLPVLERKMEGRRLLTVSREAVKRIGTLSIVYALSNEERFLTRVNDELIAVCNFSDWNPKHFLDVGEMAYGVSIGLDWTLGNLPASTQKLARQTLIDKALKPGLAVPDNSWVTGNNNWNQVCHGGLSIAAIAVADEEPELAAKIISRALANIPKALKAYAPDGAYPEGASYWNYGTSYSLLSMSAFESAFNTDFGLSQSPGFIESALFVKMLASPSGLYFNYFDSGSAGATSVENAELLSWFANKTGNAVYFDKQQLMATLAKASTDGKKATKLNGAALTWMVKVKPTKNVALPTAWKGDGVNPVVIFTSPKNNAHRFYLGVKGGAANLSHGDMDAGTFVFDLNDVRWSVDLGMPDYGALEAIIGDSLWDMKQNSKRWSLLGKSNFGHSTLTINDKRHVVDGAATLVHFNGNETSPEATFDLSKVFAGQVASAKRTFKKLSPQTLRIEDAIVLSDSTQTITWAMMTQADAVVMPGGVMLIQGNKTLKVKLLQPQNISCEIISKDPAPLPYEMTLPGLKRLEFRIPASAFKTKDAKIIVELSGE